MMNIMREEQRARMQEVQELRLTSRLLKYWNLVRKDNPMPEIEHWNTDPIKDLWPQCFRIAVDNRSAVRFTYEYMGESVISIYGRDLTGNDVDHTSSKFPGLIMYKKVQEVAGEYRPKEDNGYFVSENGKLVKYRACFLPFGSDRKGITHIIVGLSFRLF